MHKKLIDQEKNPSHICSFLFYFGENREKKKERNFYFLTLIDSGEQLTIRDQTVVLYQSGVVF